MTRILILLITLFASMPLRAGERYEFYNGIRSLGMGGAGIAVVNDETALLVNPAGLGKLRDYFITVADPEIDVGDRIEKIAGTNVQKTIDPQEVLNMLNEGNQDEHLHSRVQVFPSIVVPNFGLGIFVKYRMDAEVVSESALYNIDYERDFAGVLGFNFRLWDGRIKFGFNTRFVNRIEIKNSLPSNSTGLTVENLADEGIGVASDVGVILTAPWAWLPTFAAVWRDVGNTNYELRSGFVYDTAEDRRPQETSQTVDLGLALFPIGGKRLRWTWTAEYRDVLTSSDEEDQMRRVHTGIEMNLADALFLRGGMNQRYWTGGIEIAMLNFQLQLASYGEEIGDADTPREDRRYSAKFSYRF